MIRAFNQTIAYIESTLDGEIDQKQVAYLAGYSYPLFSRMFSILAGYPLSEYIRLRKLTRAAADLRSTTDRVIDLAFKYGYESSDAFSQAFKRFHGCTPSEVRDGAPFKVFPAIKLALTIQGGKNMEIKIEQKEAFLVAGVKAEGIDNSECPRLWERLFAKVSFDDLAGLGSGQSYGVCYEVTDCNSINYLAGYDVQDESLAQRLGLDLLSVPRAEYAVVKLRGAVPSCIHAGWKYLLEVFLPEEGYKHAGTPDFEVYYPGDMTSPDYEMELWVPLVRAENNRLVQSRRA